MPLKKSFPLSSRFPWDLRDNPLAGLLEKKEASGAALIDLTLSNPTQAGLPLPEKDILAALAHPETMRYEPHPKGLLSARKAVAGYYAGRGISLDPESLFLTASTSESYTYLFKLLCDPGDNILVPQPSYPLFEFLSGLENLEQRPYRRIDRESLSEACDQNSRALIVVHPNNPTGLYVKKDEALALAEFCQERKLALIVDEVFFDYCLTLNSEPLELLWEFPELPIFLLNGISKSLLLPQMKLGWIAALGPREFLDPAMDRLELIGDTYLSANTPAQLALPRWLELRPHIQGVIKERLEKNLGVLKESLGSHLLPPEGGWSAVLKIEGLGDEEKFVGELLEKDNTRVYPGFFFDFEAPGYLVVSLLTPEQPFRDGTRRLAARLKANNLF